MNGFPVGDWQFFVATAAVIVALWGVVRTFVPAKTHEPRCPNCPSTGARSGAGTKRAKLTVEGSTVADSAQHRSDQ